MMGFTEQLVLSQIYFSQFSRWFTFLYLRFALSCSTFTSGPSGRVGHLGARTCYRPWEGPSGPALVGLPFAAGRLAPRAADLACVCCRVDCSATGRTARAAAARAWAAAPAQAAQVWPPGWGLISPVSPTPASHVCWLARRSRRR
jgi:hypothetical protein